MGVDAQEMRSRGIKAAKSRYNTDPNIPYAAIPHRVIDSSSFADLTPSEVKILVLIVRQITKVNNGQLHAAFSHLSKFGIGSEKTIQRSIRSLIDHGFIHRTKAGAYGQGAARYAVTWLPLCKNRSGLTHVDWFKSCAWHDWEKEKPLVSRGAKNPTGHGKTNRTKMPPAPGKNVLSLAPTMDIFTGREPDKNTDDVCIPIDGAAAGDGAVSNSPESDRLAAYLSKLAEARMGNGQHASSVRSYLTLGECRRAA